MFFEVKLCISHAKLLAIQIVVELNRLQKLKMNPTDKEIIGTTQRITRFAIFCAIGLMCQNLAKKGVLKLKPNGPRALFRFYRYCVFAHKKSIRSSMQLKAGRAAVAHLARALPKPPHFPHFHPKARKGCVKGVTPGVPRGPNNFKYAFCYSNHIRTRENMR